MVFASLVVLLATFGGGLYLLRSLPPTAIAPTPDAKPGKAADKSEKPSTAEPSEKADPRFKFYDLLPESKVSTSQIDAYQPKDKDKPAETKYHYVLQTGSFRSLEEAEKHKANIAFQGIKASIETIQNAQGQTWHRVTTDTYRDEQRMNNALNKLAALNIRPIIRKIDVPAKPVSATSSSAADVKKP